MSNSLNIYFPVGNLNHQGWLTDFITPFIPRTPKRSIEANLFYDKKFLDKTYKLLEQKFNNRAEFNNFLSRRNYVDEEKIISINANHLDKIDLDQTLSDSTLTQAEHEKYLRFMSSAKPYELAFIQSYMRLSYGFKRNAKEENYTFIDFPFTQIFDKDFILGENKSGFPRTEGSGIKSINVSNEFNFVTHVNSKVTINFFFGNMKILTREMKENGSVAENEEVNKQTFPFGFNFMKLFTSFDISREIVKLEYGKKVSDGFNDYVKDKDLKDIIEKKEKKVLYLNKINHNFNFNSDGRIGLSVTYLDIGRARLLKPNTVYIPCDSSKVTSTESYKTILENYHNQKRLANEKNLEILAREYELKDSGKNQELKEFREKNKETLSEINVKLENLRIELRNNFTTIFLDKIKEQGQLFSIKFKSKKNKNLTTVTCNLSLVKPTDGNLLELREYESVYDLDEFKNFPKKQELFNKITNTPGNSNTGDGNKIFGQFQFFPLRSLIAAAYSFLCEEEKRDVPYILLGNSYTTINNKTASINIGDLLVEAETFQKWYYENCLSKDKREYSFGAFVSDIVNDLIPRILHRNKLINTNSASTVLFKNFFLTNDIQQSLKDDLYFKDSDETLRTFCSKMTPQVSENNPNALIYITQINSFSSNLQAPTINNNSSQFFYDEIKDNKKGILHIKFGADGGLIKNADFSATDNSKIASAYYYESLANSVSKVLLYYYRMSINMIGNNSFSYNSYVCVPLKALGLETTETDPGIAGYYKVISTTDQINQDLTYDTSAECVWTYSPEINKVKNQVTLNPSDNGKITGQLDVKVNSPIEYINKLTNETPDSATSNGVPTPGKLVKKGDETSKKSGE